MNIEPWRCHVRSSRSEGGIPFVLVHGFVISSLYMIPLAEELAKTSEVHAVDLPGFGRSEGPVHALSVDAMAEFLHRWLDEEGIDRCHLVGNSLGCQICTAFAVRFPSRVVSLVLTGPTIDPDAYSISRQLLRLLSDVPLESPRLWFNYAVDLVKAGPIRTVSMVRQMFRDHIETKLPDIRCPVLLLRGEYDPVAPQRWLDKAGLLVPSGQVLALARASHGAHFSHPEATARAIFHFVQERDER